jgi:biotin operon repressor
MAIDPGMAASTPTVEDKMMASFRIDRDEWNRFGLLAKRERLNATQVLTDYIQKCLDADRTYFERQMSTDNSSTDNESVSICNDDVLKLIDERISTNISTLSVQKEGQIDRLVSTAISTRLVPIQDEVKVLKEELAELKKLINSSGIKPLSALSAPDAEILPPLEKDYLTANEVSAQTGLNRQAIEKHRNKGTLSELGYNADKVGSKWRYYQTPLVSNS